ncbi:FTR1 family protein [uncultured Gilvimarinus sp.]|uniref:FTR1 family protein n=1 Tax=uncultured Gilvimarinus sp. TaxID=1689143 RepID=UPI0030D73781
MLHSVIIVLREVLEASMLISLLLAASAHVGITRAWIWLALAFGLTGAWLLSRFGSSISSLFDGMGQETVNVMLLGLVIVSLLSNCGLLLKHILNRHLLKRPWWLLWCSLATSCALSREGSEIFIYVIGFMQAGPEGHPIMTGAAIGLGVGTSIGAVLYYLLRLTPLRIFYVVAPILITLVAAGQAVEAARELIQSGWLESGKRLWDSSWIIAEDSVLGQLLYAGFGYEATPSATQLIFFSFTIAVPLTLALYWRWQAGVNHAV